MGGLRELVVARGRANGLDVVGIADAVPFLDTREALELRRSEGLNADMEFTYRNPTRSTEPSRTLPGARSLLVGAVRYAGGDARPQPSSGTERRSSRPSARVARYAVGDHDAVLRRALAAVAEDLQHAGFRAVVLADDNALVDRAAAHRAGIGWFGRNSNLLAPGLGSWFVLGSVLTDADLGPAPSPVADGCGSCRRCIDACPTAAIVADGVVDARRCLSWLLQSPEPFPHEHRVALGDRIYGCDDCQEVCPPNRRVALRDGDQRKSAEPAAVDVVRMLEASDDELLGAARRWYVPKRDPDHLRRNALLVLGNTAHGDDPEIRRLLERYLRHERSDVAGAAAWAAMRVGLGVLLDAHDVAGRAEVVAERNLQAGDGHGDVVVSPSPER